MDAEEAIKIGVRIAEEHMQVVLSIREVKPDATMEEALKGCVVWLGAKIMKEIQRAVNEEASRP
jgi:hypothetical protein